jgi:beta-galactosidase
VEVTVGTGRAVVVAADVPCDLGFWRAALARLGVRPRLAPDPDGPGLVLTSTVDRAGQRLLHLVNVAPSAVTVALNWHGEPVLTGRRLRVPARTGLILPYGVRVADATLVETTCDLVAHHGDEVLLRPTQGDDEVVLATDRPVGASRGSVTVAGGRTIVRLPGGPDDEPVRISVR